MRTTLRDGSVVSGEPEYVVRAKFLDDRMHDDKQAWIARLRAHGVKAAHPDDGWVDRRQNKVHLCYPQFNDGLEVGDLLALGDPFGGTRFVRVTATSELGPLQVTPGPWYWHFEDAAPFDEQTTSSAADSTDYDAAGLHGTGRHPTKEVQ
jgi:hypothetical protein